jgi:predicted metal-dependent phosphoesterase TrpH
LQTDKGGEAGVDSEAGLVVCDLHTHTGHSKDCRTTLNLFLETCRKRGLDRVAVTDHNTIAGALRLKEMDPERIIVGEEIKTTQGELLALFVQDHIPPGLSPEATIDRVREQGAVVGVSHPLDGLRREAMGREVLLRILERLDFIEVFNARCMFPWYNRAARELAEERGLLMTAGSDAHSAWELGRGVTIMPQFNSPASFLESLKTARIEGRSAPSWVHFLSRYAKITRALGKSPSPDS